MDTDLPLRNQISICGHTHHNPVTDTMEPDCDNVAVTQLWGKLPICSYHLRALDAQINQALAQIKKKEEEID